VPTRRGKATLAAGLACFLAGHALGIAELYAVALVAVFAVGLAVATVRWSRYRLGFSRRVAPARTFPDETVRFQLTVRNVGRLGSPPLLLEDRIPEQLGGPARHAVEPLRPEQSWHGAVDRRATGRGKFRIGPLRVRLVDPFGLAELATVNKREDQLVVFPRIETFGRGVPPSQRTGAGAARVTRVMPEGEEFYGIREYEDGDDLRKIHWASVARTGELMIRQEEARLHPRATLLLDARQTLHRGSGARSSLEWSVSAAASAAWHLGRAGFSLRLATDAGGPTSFGSGRSTLDALLESLAVLVPSHSRSLTPTIRRAAAKPGAGGALVAVMPVPPQPSELAGLGRLRAAYGWCGALLLDVDSFVETSARARAEADQRLASAEASLGRAGWRVRIVSATDGIGEAWTNLLAGPASRRRPASSRS
jgi:uncharacterized protein (DUF58 family)